MIATTDIITSLMLSISLRQRERISTETSHYSVHRIYRLDDYCHQWCRQNFAPGGGARARGARVAKFVVTKSYRNESHLALDLGNLRAFANSRGGARASVAHA